MPPPDVRQIRALEWRKRKRETERYISRDRIEQIGKSYRIRFSIRLICIETPFLPIEKLSLSLRPLARNSPRNATRETVDRRRAII